MSKPTVQIIIPTREKVALVRQCLKALRKAGAYETADLDIVVVEHDGEKVKSMIEKDFGGPEDRVRWMAASEDANFAQMNNAAAATGDSEFILCLNNDTIARSGFLAEMLKPMAKKADVGLVGAKLTFLDGTIQHIGVAFTTAGMPYHLCYGRQDDPTVAATQRDDFFDAVTFACALVRREVWDKLNGLDEQYHFNFEDVDFCLRAREAGWKCYVAHKARVTHLEGQTIGARITERKAPERHGLAYNFKTFASVWIQTGRMAKATGLPINKESPSTRYDRKNIAFIPQGRGAGVPWWRIEQPARALSRQHLANVEILYPEQGTDRLMAALDRADIAVFQGYSAEWVWRIAAMGARRNFLMVYDYDDHPLYISPFAQAYRFFGTQEVKVKLGGEEQWLWRDGEGGFNIERNMEHRQRQLEIFHMVDLVTTSTMPLHKYLSRLNPAVKLLPNQMDFDAFRDPNIHYRRAHFGGGVSPVRIGWHGGDNHFHDIMTIGAPLTKYVNEHDVGLVLFGGYYKGAFVGLDESKLTQEDWVHVEAFPYKLAMLGLDVGIIPLADPANPLYKFNHYKSNIKFLEYAAMRVPALVAEGRAAYAGCQDGVNCLTYSDNDEFLEKLHALCTDLELRRRLGAAAQQYAREHFDLEKNAHRWVDAYESAPRREFHDERTGEPVKPFDDMPERPAGSNAVAEGAPAP